LIFPSRWLSVLKAVESSDPVAEVELEGKPARGANDGCAVSVREDREGMPAGAGSDRLAARLGVSPVPCGADAEGEVWLPETFFGGM